VRPAAGLQRAGQVTDAAKTVVRRTPETLMVVRYRTQPTVVQIARLAVTALLAYVAALAVPYTSSQPVLAPLTALLVAQVTLYQTVRSAVTRVAAVVTGVLVAVAVSKLVGFTWWSLGLTVVAALIIGYSLRLGETVLEVPISAMLILSVGATRAEAADGRIVETLVGGGAGLLAGLVLAAPKTESAREAIFELCGKMCSLLDQMAAGLRDGSAREMSARWLDRARALAEEIERVDEAVQHAQESIVLNPRSLSQPADTVVLQDSLETLEHASIIVRGLARSLADLARLGDGDSSVREHEDRNRLAAVLTELSASIREYVQLATTPDLEERRQAESELRDHLGRARERQDRLSTLLAANPADRPVGWPLRGELVIHVDRLRNELEAAADPAVPEIGRGHLLPGMLRRVVGRR
jgi:uncharacterized membrane protein YgaE (UPF0421/DUF939 family)